MGGGFSGWVLAVGVTAFEEVEISSVIGCFIRD